MMKLVLLLVIFCLGLHNGTGAPATAVYKFVKCNPKDGQANCKTYQSTQMPWSPDLPGKLPASAAQYLDPEPEEGESPPREEGEDHEVLVGEEEAPMKSEDGESPMMFPGEEGSGGYEGSAAEGPYLADSATAAETGSGEAWTADVLQKDGNVKAMRKLFPSSFFTREPKPTEQDLKEDHLLKL